MIAREVTSSRRNRGWPGRIAVCVATMALSVVSLPVRTDLPAFPGAEGFGATSLGGRGGRVLRVTNLNADGPGSLQAACETKGPRIVVFAVAGVIRGDVTIRHPRITIAGQTAPAPGITIAGRLLARPAVHPVTHDVIVQHLRFRPPPATGHGGDVVQLPHGKRVMLDHLSLAWGNDEMIDLMHTSDFTLQWSTVEESDPEGHGKNIPHNFALLSAYSGSGNISIHRNLFAHHARRLPSIASPERQRPADFRNNVIYNFRDGLSHEGHVPLSPINLIGNYYKRGPDAERLLLFHFHRRGGYYLADNFVEGVGVVGDPRRSRVLFPIWLRHKGKGSILRAPAIVPAVSTLSPIAAYREVMRRAGAFPRDRVTKRTLQEVVEGTGSWGRHAPANPSDEWFVQDIGHEQPVRDRDGDGMADDWERLYGLSPRDPSDYNRVRPSGYTAIEEYLHFRTAEVERRAASGSPTTTAGRARMGSPRGSDTRLPEANR